MLHTFILGDLSHIIAIGLTYICDSKNTSKTISFESNFNQTVFPHLSMATKL